MSNIEQTTLSRQQYPFGNDRSLSGWRAPIGIADIPVIARRACFQRPITNWEAAGALRRLIFSGVAVERRAFQTGAWDGPAKS